MKAFTLIEQDERSVAVENASYRWSFLTLTTCLLLDVMYRSAVLKEACFDLLTLLCIAGFVSFAYQAYFLILHRHWMQRMALLILIQIRLTQLGVFFWAAGA